MVKTPGSYKAVWITMHKWLFGGVFLAEAGVLEMQDTY